jgi:Zn-finger nucleic acid-binding protein
MNVQEAPLCVGCGHELGLEPVGGPGTLACPDCNRQLLAFKGEGGVLHDCGRCGGQFVDHALLEALLAGRERYGQAAPHKPPRHNPLDSPVRYVRCPACLEIMTRKNFGRVSGIIVDVCRQHGMWFDVGELPRVLAFAEAGGLALAREKEIEARAELMARRKLEAENAFSGLSGPVHPFDRTIASTRMAEAGAALLAFVRQTLRGG